MISLFVYGTLCNSRIRQMLLGKEVHHIQAILAGYEKTTVNLDGEEFANIKESQGNAISRLFITINQTHLRILDDYESAGYLRKEVILENGIKPWVYQSFNEG